MSGFNIWFIDRLASSTSCTDKRLLKLAKGPFFIVTTYQGHAINGYTFYTIDQDKKSVYQNSAIRVDAFDSKMQKIAYYGQIEEIWELLYVGFKVPIFCCRWVQVSQGVMKDRYGFTTVDLNQVGYRDEPYKQVTYFHSIAHLMSRLVWSLKSKVLLDFVLVSLV